MIFTTISQSKRIMWIGILFIMAAHFIDLISTIIALSVGASESNTLFAWFFSFGPLGLFFPSIFIFVITYSIFITIYYVFEIYKRTTYKQVNISLVYIVYAGVTVFMIYGIMSAVLNNIIVAAWLAG